MKLRSLKDIFSTSICINPGTTKIEEPKVTADSSIYDFLPDQIGQGADRLFYAGGRVIVLPSEEYGKALQIAEQMDNIIGQDKRLAYWDEHPNVFGEACMIVFDTYKKQYWAHHGRTQDDYI